MKLIGRVSVVALTVLAASTLAFAGQKGVAQGTVTSVSHRIVSVVGENGEAWTFEVTQGARVYAQGATHKSQMLVSNGKATTMDAFVQEGHHVTVYFKEQDGTRYLTKLRVHGRAAQS